NNQPRPRSGDRPLYGLDQMIEFVFSLIHGLRRRVHVIWLQQVGKGRLAFHLPQKLIYAETALLSDKFNHEFDVMSKGMNRRIKGAAEDAGIPASINDKQLCMQAVQNLIHS